MEKAKISIKQIWLKASSKKEIYRILQLEGDVFLPPSAEVNHADIEINRRGEESTVTS